MCFEKKKKKSWCHSQTGSHQFLFFLPILLSLSSAPREEPIRWSPFPRNHRKVGPICGSHATGEVILRKSNKKIWLILIILIFEFKKNKNKTNFSYSVAFHQNIILWTNLGGLELLKNNNNNKIFCIK